MLTHVIGMLTLIIVMLTTVIGKLTLLIVMLTLVIGMLKVVIVMFTLLIVLIVILTSVIVMLTLVIRMLTRVINARRDRSLSRLIISKGRREVFASPFITSVYTLYIFPAIRVFVQAASRSKDIFQNS